MKDIYFICLNGKVMGTVTGREKAEEKKKKMRCDYWAQTNLFIAEYNELYEWTIREIE